MHASISTFVCVLSLQVEFGAGDILGPLIGLKMFRNITPRRSGWGRMHAVLGYDRRSPFVVPFLGVSVVSFFAVSWQLRVVCSSLLEDCGQAALWWQHATWTRTPWVICNGAGAPTVPWRPVWSETQRAVTLRSLCRSIQKYIHMDWTYNIYLYVLNHLSFIPTCPSWGCLTPTWWWATITSFRMMTTQKWKALLSRFSSYHVFNKSFAWSTVLYH